MREGSLLPLWALVLFNLQLRTALATGLAAAPSANPPDYPPGIGCAISFLPSLILRDGSHSRVMTREGGMGAATGCMQCPWWPASYSSACALLHRGFSGTWPVERPKGFDGF